MASQRIFSLSGLVQRFQVTILVFASFFAANLHASPSVSGPILPNTPSIGATTFTQLGAVGYQQAEYFFSGTATSYESATALTADGKWNGVAPSGIVAPYQSRMLVFSPTDPSRFNGTVYVEWFNVSGFEDATPEWSFAHNQIIREGGIYVGVSAQFLGVNSLTSGVPNGNPARYGALFHPGDSFSYDIFSQAGQAIRDSSAIVLNGLTPQRLLALGSSRSAHRLVTYVNAVHPLAQMYDGYLLHSRIQVPGMPLSQSTLTVALPYPSPFPAADIPVPASAVRDDQVPVLGLQSETDLAGTLLGVRQPNSDNYRLWEVAGSAHIDFYGLAGNLFDTGDGSAGLAGLLFMQNPISVVLPGVIECALPINTGPMHYVTNSAVNWLNRWATFGDLPPVAPLIETLTAPGLYPVVFKTDVHGNALGGVRTPHVETPIATLGGAGNGPAPGAPPNSAFCGLFGSTQPFDDSTIASLYKNHGQFTSKWSKATQRAFKAGFLVKEDADELKIGAEISDIAK